MRPFEPAFVQHEEERRGPIFACASDTAFKKEDFPAEGLPTQAINTSCIFQKRDPRALEEQKGGRRKGG